MKKDLLKPGLSFEEFEKLAVNIPKRRLKTIFKLVVGTLSYYSDDDRMNMYPEYRYTVTTKGFFNSKEEAQKGFSECFEWSKRNSGNILFFKIFEMPLNRISFFGNDGNQNAVREYLYDETGSEIDHTVCSGVHEDYGTKFGIYLSKPKSQQRFKAGDLVEIMDNGKIKLAVVAHDPVDTEWCYNYYLRSKESKIGYVLDASDDQIAVIDGYGYITHQHVPLCDIMRPHFPIPENIRKKFQKYYEYMLRESEEYKKKNNK